MCYQIGYPNSIDNSSVNSCYQQLQPQVASKKDHTHQIHCCHHHGHGTCAKLHSHHSPACHSISHPFTCNSLAHTSTCHSASVDLSTKNFYCPAHVCSCQRNCAKHMCLKSEDNSVESSRRASQQSR